MYGKVIVGLCLVAATASLVIGEFFWILDSQKYLLQII
jgi:hypothetical protein